MSYRPESAGHPPHYSRDSAKGIEQRLSSQACGPLKSALQLRATCSGAELACIGVCLLDRRPNRSSISMSMPAWRNSAPGLFHPSAEDRGQSSCTNRILSADHWRKAAVLVRPEHRHAKPFGFGGPVAALTRHGRRQQSFRLPICHPPRLSRTPSRKPYVGRLFSPPSYR